MKKSKEKERLLLMLAGIAINILGNRLGTLLGISFFPSAIGTVLVAVLAGYLPGIVTGFISTLVEAVFVTNTIYYGLPAIVLAAVSAWLAQRGIFEKWYKVILAIPALVCTYGVVHGIISWLVRATDIADQEMFSSSLPSTSSPVSPRALVMIPKKAGSKTFVRSGLFPCKPGMR